MREYEIIPQLKSDIESVTGNEVDVRTTGGDQDVDPPEVIIDWSATRLPNENGHNSFGEYITDDNGNHVGIEYHGYWRMEVDFRLRYYDEFTRDEVLDAVQMAFLPYEKDADAFNEDTARWEVGSAGPRENSVLEMDWYSAGVPVSFVYLKRSENDNMDYIESIEDSVHSEEFDTE